MQLLNLEEVWVVLDALLRRLRERQTGASEAAVGGKREVPQHFLNSSSEPFHVHVALPKSLPVLLAEMYASGSRRDSGDGNACKNYNCFLQCCDGRFISINNARKINYIRLIINYN